MMYEAYLRQEVKGHLRVDVPFFRLKKNTGKKVILVHISQLSHNHAITDMLNEKTIFFPSAVLYWSNLGLGWQYSFNESLPAL